MAVRPSWYYERLATHANAREAYRRRNPPRRRTTVRSRGAATTVYYRSLLFVDGTDSRLFSTSVDADTLAVVSATQAGLLTTAPANTAIFNLRGSGVTPTKIHWMKGAATPSVERTAWESQWIKYYEGNRNDNIRSHYSMPFSRSSGAFDAQDLMTAFETIFNGTRRAELLGSANGRAYITFEKAPITVNT